MAARIYMIPCPIAENATHTIPAYVKDTIFNIKHFIVERSKTARKYLKEIQHPTPQQELDVVEMDKHDKSFAQKILKDWITQDIDIGIISEAGCPGIADPGAELVSIAHQHNVRVMPLIGPSSIFLALMASGMNGQKFTFHGYLPHKNPALKNALRSIEKSINKDRSAEIFIETPYRNQSLFKEITSSVSAQLKLCIAGDITGEKEKIQTFRIKDWKKKKFPFKDKTPAIFILGI